MRLAGSYEVAESAMRELCGVRISLQRIRRVVNQVGEQRVAERDAAVGRFQEMDLARRREAGDSRARRTSTPDRQTA